MLENLLSLVRSEYWTLRFVGLGVLRLNEYRCQTRNLVWDIVFQNNR